MNQHNFYLEYKNNMNFFLFLLTPLTMSLLYDPNKYTIGNNLISNFDFSRPLLASNVASTFYNLNMPNWNCTYKCQHIHVLRRCQVWNTVCNTSYFQAIEIDATFNLDSYTQIITLIETGLYQLQIGWFPAFYLPLNKNMLVKVNSTLIGKVYVTDALMEDHLFQMLVNLTAGQTVFQISEETASDSYGAHIGRIDLQYLTPIPTNTSNTAVSTQIAQISQLVGAPLSYFTHILLENFTQSVNLFPGSRVFTYSLTNFLLTFDRLQFYYYHNQNLTYSSQILLYNANKMGLERGSIAQKLMESEDNQFCSAVTNTYNSMVSALDYKQNYTESFLLTKNPNGMSFFANNLDFFFYELPIIFVTYAILLMIFRALFNYRISKYIRKYSFYGILLLIIYQGNVEQFTFFFFNQCRNLFSINFQHKLVNVFIIYFFFLMLVFSIGGLLFFTFNYRKLVKYFLEDSETANIEAAVLQSLQRSTFPMIFGAVHALFLEWLWLQTIILFVVELSYLGFKMFTLRSVTPRYKFKVVMCAVSSLLRLGFIVTFYMYEHYNSPEIMNMVHYDMVLLYLICWIVEFLHDCVVFVVEIKEAVWGLCKIEQKLTQQEKQEKAKQRQKGLKNKKQPKSDSELKNNKEEQRQRVIRKGQTNIFYIKQHKEHKRSQSSINDMAFEKLEGVYEKKRSKSDVEQINTGLSSNKTPLVSKQKLKETTRTPSKAKSRHQTLTPLKGENEDAPLQMASKKTIIIKSTRQIPKIPTMIIKSLHEDGLFPATPQ